MPLILQVLPNLQGGGAERVAINLGNDWLNRGFDVEFALMSRTGEFLPLVSGGITIHDMRAPRIRDVFLRLYSYLRNKRPDVTLVHMWPLTSVGVFAWLLAGRPGKLFVCEHVGLTNHVERDLKISLGIVKFSLCFTHRFASGVVGVSQGAAADLAKFAALPYDKIAVIHNPIVTPTLASRPVRAAAVDLERLWGGCFKHYLVSVGTLKKQKNHKLLLEAFSDVCGELDAGLVILGEGGERVALEQQITHLGLNHRVFLSGFHPNPTPWLQAANLFVLSSDFEGFANVLAESLACGLPVLSTNCPHGPEEILSGGRYGILVPVGDRVALANGIRSGLSRPWDSKTLQHRALDFSIPKKSLEYLTLFGFPTRSNSD